MALARRLGIGRVIVPPAAGVLSAVGFLAAPFAFDFVHSYLARLSALDWEHVNGLLDAMEQRGRSLLREAGVAPEDVVVARSAEMRYVGQVHEISVALPTSGRLGPESAAAIHDAYERTYERLYQRANLGYEVELLSWHVVVRGPRPPTPIGRPSSHDRDLDRASRGTRTLRFGGQSYEDCPRYERDLFPIGMRLSGPAVLEDPDSTIVVLPDSTATIDQHANVVIELGQDR